MDDLISRQAAIDALKAIKIGLWEIDIPHPGNCPEYIEHHKQIQEMMGVVGNWIERIKALPTAEPKWIPCSERLPDEETDVLVTRSFLGCKDGSRGWNNHIPPKTYVEVAECFDGEWTALSDEYKVARNRHTDPVAWMPLPKPYEEESDEADKREE